MGFPVPTYPVNGTWIELTRWRNMLLKYIIGLSGTITWNPASLNDGEGETSSSITVTGAVLGDMVMVSAPYDLQGVQATAYVDVVNSVKIRVQNETGGVVNLASGVWKVKVVS